jgi:hypothetical protein
VVYVWIYETSYRLLHHHIVKVYCPHPCNVMLPCVDRQSHFPVAYLASAATIAAAQVPDSQCYVARRGDGSLSESERRIVVTRAILESLFHLPLNEAAKHVGLSNTTFKKACRRFGVMKWPYRRSDRGVVGENTTALSFQPIEYQVNSSTALHVAAAEMSYKYAMERPGGGASIRLPWDGPIRFNAPSWTLCDPLTAGFGQPGPGDDLAAQSKCSLVVPAVQGVPFGQGSGHPVSFTREHSGNLQGAWWYNSSNFSNSACSTASTTVQAEDSTEVASRRSGNTDIVTAVMDYLDKGEPIAIESFFRENAQDPEPFMYSSVRADADGQISVSSPTEIAGCGREVRVV